MKHSPLQTNHSKEYHVPWGFRRKAFIFDGEKTIGPNFRNASVELHDWMGQAGKLTIMADRHKRISGAITNPYTYHISSITLILGHVINACHDFNVSRNFTDPDHAEISRIRLQNELVLYLCRFYEVAVKQMLFLTNFSSRRYKSASIGRLLQYSCVPCRKAGQPHYVSLLGSLAHPYKLCLELEDCLYGTMQKISRMRNAEAAHATAQEISTQTIEGAQEQLGKVLYDLGTEFRHSLVHLAKLEEAIFNDLVAKSNTNS